MNCSKCGSTLVQGDSFCRKCGASINTLNQNVNINDINQPMNTNQVLNNPNQIMNNNQPINNTQPVYNQPVNNQVNYANQPVNNQVNYANQYNQPIYSNQDMDEDLKRAYVGDKYDEFKRGVGATPVLVFFLGACYTLYRKMYLLSVLWIVVSLILSVFLPGIGWIFSLGITIFLMIKFRDIYLKHVDDEIKKIRENNPGASRDELIRICNKKGGTNIVIAIIVPIIYFAIIVLLAIPLIYGVINEAKEGAYKSEVLGYVDTVEKQLALNSVNDPYYEYPSYISDPSEFSVTGDEPDSVFLMIDSQTGEVYSGTITYGDVTYRYSYGEVSLVED